MARKLEITDIPCEIIGLVGTFLKELKLASNLISWRNFLNSCKSLFFAKLKWVYFNFNKKSSKTFIFNSEFTRRINSLVLDPSLQIQLRLCGKSGLDVHELFKQQFFSLRSLHSLEISACYLPSLSLLEEIRNLQLVNCEIHMSKSHTFPNLHSLSLITCKFINSVSPLLTLSLFPVLMRLEIIDYHLPLDVSSFGSIPQLIFNGCSTILGLESLTDVRVLHIRHCSSVEDLSKLQRVTSLDVSFCSSLVQLGSHPELHTLFVCPLTLHLLEQNDNYNVNLIVEGDVSEAIMTYYLEPYQRLSLVNNSQIEHFEGFPMLHSLTLMNLENLRSIADLPSLKKFSVYGCPRLYSINLYSLPQLKSLNISEKLVDAESVENQETLNFS